MPNIQNPKTPAWQASFVKDAKSLCRWGKGTGMKHYSQGHQIHMPVGVVEEVRAATTGEGSHLEEQRCSQQLTARHMGKLLLHFPSFYSWTYAGALTPREAPTPSTPLPLPRSPCRHLDVIWAQPRNDSTGQCNQDSKHSQILQCTDTPGSWTLRRMKMLALDRPKSQG